MQLTSSRPELPPADAPYVWPPYESAEGRKLPHKARILTGTLDVPPDLPRGVLAPMDERYRSILWPPSRIEGFVRLARQFIWADGGRVLHYRIIDVPMSKRDLL